MSVYCLSEYQHVTAQFQKHNKSGCVGLKGNPGVYIKSDFLLSLQTCDPGPVSQSFSSLGSR